MRTYTGLTRQDLKRLNGIRIFKQIFEQYDDGDQILADAREAVFTAHDLKQRRVSRLDLCGDYITGDGFLYVWDTIIRDGKSESWIRKYFETREDLNCAACAAGFMV